jgi:hypothetical protein
MESIEAVRVNGSGSVLWGGEVGVDRVGEVGDAVEDVAAECFVCEFAKPAFDEAEPGARGRDEVEVEAGWRSSQASTLACLWVR